MKNPVHSIRLISDSLTFCASHFITFSATEHRPSSLAVMEPLHGHNFRVRAKITGPLGEAEYLVDFLAASDVLREILDSWHHKILLAQHQPKFHIAPTEDEIEILSLIDSRRWIFPRRDVIFLDCRNTTTESLVFFLAREFMKRLDKADLLSAGPERYRLQLALEEESGMIAEVDLEGDDFQPGE